jgi:hypothetical protein
MRRRAAGIVGGELISGVEVLRLVDILKLILAVVERAAEALVMCG